MNNSKSRPSSSGLAHKATLVSKLSQEVAGEGDEAVELVVVHPVAGVVEGDVAGAGERSLKLVPLGHAPAAVSTPYKESRRGDLAPEQTGLFYGPIRRPVEANKVVELPHEAAFDRPHRVLGQVPHHRG